jgi:hypothetical protein
MYLDIGSAFPGSDIRLKNSRAASQSFLAIADNIIFLHQLAWGLWEHEEPNLPGDLRFV